MAIRSTAVQSELLTEPPVGGPQDRFRGANFAKQAIERTNNLSGLEKLRLTDICEGGVSMSQASIKAVPVARHHGVFWRAALLPLRILFWPLVKVVGFLDKNFVSYLTGRVLRDESRVYNVKFIWYGESVYLHPMIWGSLILYALAATNIVAPGWLLLFWFFGLCLCYVTVMYDFNVVRAAILAISVGALMGLAYFATMEFSWNPLLAVANHIRHLEAQVTPGFYLASAYLFALLIVCEVVWAWMFHRVQIDESYVYEHRLLSGTSREPIFARGLKRETKDLLEMILLGAADIQHRTKNGFKRFRNVPFASWWLGTAIDSLLDHRRKGEVELSRKARDDSDQVRITDAFQDLDGFDDEGDDEGNDEGNDEGDQDEGDDQA